MAPEAISPPGWRRLEARTPAGGSPLAHGFGCSSDVPGTSQAGSPRAAEGAQGHKSSDSWAGARLIRKEYVFAATS